MTNDRQLKNKVILKLLDTGLMSKGFDIEHHGSSNILRHCVDVARTSVSIANKLHINVNKEDLIMGALLHDYYIFEWRRTDCSFLEHLFIHSRVAAHNAKRDYGINKKVYNIIKSHMFPLNIILPNSKEALIVCLADKICASKEQLSFVRGNRK